MIMKLWSEILGRLDKHQNSDFQVVDAYDIRLLQTTSGFLRHFHFFKCGQMTQI